MHSGSTLYPTTLYMREEKNSLMSLVLRLLHSQQAAHSLLHCLSGTEECKRIHNDIIELNVKADMACSIDRKLILQQGLLGRY